MIGKFASPERSNEAQKLEIFSEDAKIRISDVPSMENLHDRFCHLFENYGNHNNHISDSSEIYVANSRKKVELDNGACVELPEPLVDDNGKIYVVDGKLQPNITYVLNGNIYTTDDKGRIIRCIAKPVRSPENPRDVEAQLNAGGVDRRPNDQGGHIIGRDLNGDGGMGNLVAMDSKINQSDYKRMENDVKKALDVGREVTTETALEFSDLSERPDKLIVSVISDDKKTIYLFDNNLDGALIDSVPERGIKLVKSKLDVTNGQISSIKSEYSRTGTLDKVTVNITFTDENGKNYRDKIVIVNINGEMK